LKTKSLLIVSILLLAGTAALAAKPIEGGMDADRVQAIAAFLPQGAFGFGPPITDRAAWEHLAATKQFAGAVADAEKLLAKPVPEMTEDIYREFNRTGQRTENYRKTRSARYGRIAAYVLAECVENKGRFLPPLEKLVASICDEPTWTYNFHDPDLRYWQGKAYFVDLGAVEPAHALADALHLLGDKLDEDTRKLIVTNLRRRILQPYRAAVEGTAPAMWWITAEMNWNAVCHAGVVGTALGACDDPAEKAFYVAAAEKYMHDYLAGFGPDGLCAEGMGYWGYGFGNFTTLSEEVWQATGGKVDLFDLPGAKLAALYPVRLEIINGVLPAMEDCPPNPKPGAYPLQYLNRRYGLNLARWQTNDFTRRSSDLPVSMMLSNPNSATAQPPTAQLQAANPQEFYELRSYFDHGGVLVCRPAKNSDGKLGVAFKGGYNDQPHNHNDLGTFITVVGDQALILDPGGEVYNSRTFSKDRYKSNLLNSFGHPVPIVAGKLQSTGKQAVAKILKADFTDDADTWAMDLSSAYAVPELTRLVRTFTYHRAGAASLTVADDVAFTSPQTFAGAMITYGKWRQEPDGSILVYQHGQAVSVAVDAGGQPFEVAGVTIDENSDAPEHAKPTHISIALKNPVKDARVVLTVKPAAAPAE